MNVARPLLASLVLLVPLPSLAAAQEEFTPIRFGDPAQVAYDAPFFPGALYDDAIPTPDAILGQLHGSRLSHHEEILECFLRWAASSPRLKLYPHGQTHEGRELVHAVITSPANHARLDAIRADLGRLHDPRGLSDADAERIVTSTPPVAWLGYSIHGDELSGSDAAVALAYHLVAGAGDDLARLLDRVVIVVDPVMNPDGRERIVSMVEQSSGRAPNLDYASMHRGRWPYGRGNHYLFDMNRDWMVGSQPETVGRWKALLSFHPQLFVDAHEMGSLDTYLFYPQAEPLNPFFSEQHTQWQRTYAEAISKAFDRYGWGYYTREWADGWAPFYSDSWGSLSGAIGILYEQARTLGTSLKRASGQVLTYRESVHHQAVASLANVEALAANAEPALRAYLATARRNVAADTPGNDRMFVVLPGTHDERVERLLAMLLGQGVEAYRSTRELTVRNAVDGGGATVAELALPVGTLVVPARQPMGPMVRAYLEFDVRLDAEALRKEREDLEREGETRIYDLTAWSVPHALDLDAWWCDAAEVPATEARLATERGGKLVSAVPGADAVAWVVDGEQDGSVVFAAHAMELGLAVHVSDEEFTTGGVTFARGSVLVRRHENDGTAEELAGKLTGIAWAAGVDVHATGTGLSPDDGPDLGGGHFSLLSRPRVAVLANSPVAPDTYGHLWHHLDVELGIPFTLLDAQQLGGFDLRRYNVLILPPTYGALRGLLEPHLDALETWVEAGGTLIACGDSAAALTRDALGLSQVARRRDALEELESYAIAARRQREARAVTIDEAAVWGTSPAAAEASAETEDEPEDEPDAPDEEQDSWMRTFAPYGVTLRAEVDDRHWLTVGCGDELPVYFSGSVALLSKPPVSTPLRLAPADSLRLSGLVWPEARARLADSAWLTSERRGNGQVILFAAVPAFRGYHLATARVFANAVVYGPGLGASLPLGW
jgi:hypothetical protein